MALFYCHKAANSGLSHHKRQSYITHRRKAPHIKQKRPKSPRKRTVSGDVGRFLFSKANSQTRRGQGSDADAPYAEISQERMGVLSWRLRRKKYNPLPSDKLLKGAQLICNEPFLRIFARLNIQHTDLVFVRHCNNAFFDNKNTAVSGDTAGDNKYKVSGPLCVRRGRLTGGHLRRYKPPSIFKP